MGKQSIKKLIFMLLSSDYFSHYKSFCEMFDIFLQFYNYLQFQFILL
jgi:hypothetical protein